MKRVLGVAAGLILLGGLFVTRASGSSESDAATAAQSAAKAWLAETDGGRYGESWEHAAELMRKAISKADWEKALSGARGSLGAVKSRTLRSATYSKTLPNAPAGEYVVILYDTTFEKKGSAVETVTPMREKDGAWRVSGYYIQETGPVEGGRRRMALSWRSPKTEVRSSPIHGRGLFAVEPIARDEIVVIKGGYVLDADALRGVSAELGPAEIQIADGFFIGPRRGDERDGGMIFSNHSCEPNIGVAGQIVFVALRDIAAGEELTHDWATTDDDTYELECRCGVPSCRKVLTGQDWRNSELQKKYGEHMSWYLRRKIEESKTKD